METYIQVDSRYRALEPSFTYHTITPLTNDPIWLEKGSDLAAIKYANDLTVHDSVMLFGVKPRVMNTHLSIKKGSRYAIITDPDHGLETGGVMQPFLEPLPDLFSPNTIIHDSTPQTILSTSYTINVQGYLNGDHNISIVSPNTYAISLPLVSTINQLLPVTITINYLHEFSFDSEPLSIHSRTDEDITIIIPLSNHTGWIGGSDVQIAHVSHYEPAWPKPNRYTYYLHRAYINPVVKLISSVFPNDQYVVDDGTLILEDENGITEISIPPGNYDIPSITSALSKYLNVKSSKHKIELSWPVEIYADSHTVPEIIKTSVPTVYKNALYLNGRISFDKNVICDFGLETEEQMTRCVKSINTCTKFDFTYDGDWLIINQHNLKLNDYVITDRLSNTVRVYLVSYVMKNKISLIESSEVVIIDDFIISTGSIAKHEYVVGEDAYTIVNDLVCEAVYQYGKISIIKGIKKSPIAAPRLFRLRDTKLKSLLGITSNDYQYSFINDKPIKLTGEPYMYLCCDELPAITNTGDVNNVLTIVKRREDPERILVDQHIPVTVRARTLDRLTISIVSAHNEPIDVGDHSFTLSIIEMASD